MKFLSSNKKVVMICVLLVIFCSFFLVYIQNEYFIKEKNIILKSDTETHIINSNAITMMYETVSGSGEYQTTTDTLWPQEGYVFNERLSGCENGGTLSWNSETNRVIMESNTSDRCYVYFDKYATIKINKVETNKITSNVISIDVSAVAGTNPITKYYYSIDNGNSYNVSSNSNWTFSSLNVGTHYSIKVYAIDSNGFSSDVYNLNVSTLSSFPSLTSVCSNGNNLASCIKNYYNTYWESTGGLYYHDGIGTYTNANQEAGDNSYRYSGANPNNYVCFAYEDSTGTYASDWCPDDNLYRIIGVFGTQVKLIKYSGFYNTYWSGSSSILNNNWAESSMNTYTLNQLFISRLNSSVWSNKIATATWYVGGGPEQYIIDSPVKTSYDYELGSHRINTTYSAKIGLMYASDWGYASLPNDWLTDLGKLRWDASDYNWNKKPGTFPQEWMITRVTDNNERALVNDGSYLVSHKTNFTNHGTRPVFYLNSSITYSGGSGTKSDPIRIN